jgi:menaquinone-9 beta-reductase
MVRIINTQQTDTDILIAGAGPAGASLAVNLCRMGYHVTMIDAKTFPRDKICGDFAGPVALQELEALGIDLPAGEGCRIDGAAVFLDGRQLIEQRLPPVNGLPAFGKVIPRLVLDEKIFRAAVAAGAGVVENCRLLDFTIGPSHAEAVCSHDGRRRNITAKMIVGADGSNSTVARLFHGFRHPPGSRILAARAYYRGVGGPVNRADLFFSSKSFPGYYWLFPAGEGMANVGVGMIMKTLPKGEHHLRDMLTELIDADPSLHDRMKDASLAGNIEVWPLPIFNPALRCAGDRLLLTGDAGGLVNALNGEGIQYALLSGRWASDTIKQAIDSNDFSKIVLEGFSRRVDREIGYDLALSGTIIGLIRNRSLNPLWLDMLRVIVQRASIDPAYAGTAGGILAGAVPASRVINPGFIAKTALQAGIHFGFKGMRLTLGGPRRWRAAAGNALRKTSSLAGEVAGDPENYMKWAAGSVKEIARLARYTVNDMIIG